jgi:multicomponent Na+:H+ antiporter subunit F
VLGILPAHFARSRLRMEAFYVGGALFLLLNIVAGLVRLVRGPTAADRIASMQLFGTAGVAAILLLAEASGDPTFRNVALVFALLAAMTIIVFVKRVWIPRAPESP